MNSVPSAHLHPPRTRTIRRGPFFMQLRHYFSPRHQNQNHRRVPRQSP